MSGPINVNSQGQRYAQPYNSQNPTGPTIIALESKIVEYNRNSKAAFETKSGLENKKEKFESFIDDVNNPKLPVHSYFYNFQTQVGLEICNTVCNAVSLAITNNANVEVGKKLLTENFLLILRIKDSDGNNPLDKIIAHFSSLYETYRLIGEINYMGSALTLLQRAIEKAKGQSAFSQPFVELRQRREEAITTFKGLTPEARGILAERLWKIDGQPQIYDYGLKTALEDILKLVDHKGKCIIKESLSELETRQNPSFSFHVHCAYQEMVLPTDTASTKEIIQQIYYLQDLKLLLAEPNRNNDFIASKYNKLSPKRKTLLKEIRETLCRIIALSSNKPQSDIGFGEHILNTSSRWLVKTQNKQGITIIDQMISHYTAKLQLSRMEKEVNDYINGTFITDRQRLDVFNQSLRHEVKEDLRYKIWYCDGGKDNPKFGEWGYGQRKIENQPGCLSRRIETKNVTILEEYLLELQAAQKNADKALIHALERARALPDESIDVSTAPLEQEPGLIDHLPANVRLAVVTAEFKPAGLGGLKPAVTGMVEAFGKDTRVVMPLYRNGPIRDDLIASMKETDHQIWADGRRVPVMKAKVDGVRCYFIDHPVFFIPRKSDGAIGNIYGDDYKSERYKWAVFQKSAADLCYNFSKKRNDVKLVHCHDAQTGLVPFFLKQLHHEEWIRGETPVVHFTYHNNAEPMTFDGETAAFLEHLHLPKEPVNSFIKALEIADVSSTVSKQFGKESQMRHSDFGKGMHDFVKRAAKNENLFGVVNGNTISIFDPRNDEQLKEWTSVLPGTLGQKPDLRFGPNSSAQDLAQNTVRIQKELCTYLKGLHPNDPAYADLDPEKPIILFLGRYDSGQKGVGWLPTIMHEAISSGAQFICVGLEPDDESKRILEDMKGFARERGNKGVLVLEDSRVTIQVNGKDITKLKYQDVFGKLLRSVCVPVFPSKFEPCGLVQGESHCYGRKPIATATGGFVDTIKTQGWDANGYLFKRCNAWNSAEQGEEIKITVREAIEDAKKVQHALYHGSPDEAAPYMEQVKAIMRNGLNSTWEKTPDGSPSPIVKRQLVDAKGFQRLKLRGGAGYIELVPLNASKILHD